MGPMSKILTERDRKGIRKSDAIGLRKQACQERQRQKTEKKRIEELRKNGTHDGMLRARGHVARRPSFLDSPGFGLGLKPSEENDEPRQRAISAPGTPGVTLDNG